METIEERVYKAQKLLESDKYPEALTEFCKLLYDYPKNPLFLKICSFLFDRMIEGNYDFEPETAEQYMSRGLSKFYKKEIEESLVDYDKALTMNPKLDYVIKCKAFSLTHLGRNEQAITLLLDAVKLNPKGEYYDDIAENYSIIGEMEKAMFFHDKAIKHSPDDARLWYNYGVHLGECGLITEAIKMFSKAIELYPQYEDAIVNLQIYLERLKG